MANTETYLRNVALKHMPPNLQKVSLLKSGKYIQTPGQSENCSRRDVGKALRSMKCYGLVLQLALSRSKDDTVITLLCCVMCPLMLLSLGAAVRGSCSPLPSSLVLH